MTLKNITFHPVLIFLLFILSIFSDIKNYGVEIDLIVLAAWLIVFFITILLIINVCKLCRFDKIKTGMFLTFNIWFILFFRQITEFLKNLELFSRLLYFSEYKEVITLVIYLFLGLTILLLLKKNLSKSFVNLNLYLNLFILALLIYSCIIVFTFKEVKIKLKNELALNDSVQLGIEYPDIYYFILDAYTSSASFKTYYNFDNSLFEGSLQKKGFYIVPMSKSNYNITMCSLPSFINSSYLNINENHLISKNDKNELLRLINHSQILPYLNKMNYDIYSYNSMSFNDKSINIQIEDKLSKFSFLKNTLYLQCIKYFYYRSDNSEKKQLMLYDYSLDFYNYVDSVSKLKSDKPKFLIAYSYAPHGSFAFGMDENGNFKSLSEIPNIKTRYLNQVKYTNDRILNLVDSLMHSKGRDQIIIIHADHGSHNFDLEESTTIFNSFYFSDKDYSLLYDSISPVNNFRVILKKIFDPNIDILQDSCFHVGYGN